jgi:hypothetical protein
MRALSGMVVIVLVLSVATGARADELRQELLEGLRLNLPVTATPPPLALKRLDSDRTLTLRDLRGRPVLLYFWATW